jgi:hypothetical protein
VGLGTLLLSGANLYTGATTINAGTLLVNGSTASGSAVAVNSGGTLGGSGTVGTVTVNSSGTLAPGTTSGILNTGNLSLNSGGTFSVDLNGTTAGTGYDQANVTGTVSLGSATLSGFLGSGFTPTAGNTFVIINNDSSDLVTGIFNGLPQGASLTIGGTSFHISYNFNNGSGSNDVALIADSAPVITTTGGTTAYTENGAGLAIDTGLTVTDADSTNLTGATVSITGNFASGQDVLGFVNTASITGSYNASTGVLTLSGTTTLANYLTALRSVTYWNSSDNPSTATRTISFTATDDGSATSNTATKSVSVTAVNDAPVAAAVPSAPQTLPYAAAITDVTISASDIDNSGSQLTASTQFNFNGGSFNSGLPSGLSLSVPTSNGSAVPGSASWTLSGNMNVLPGTYVVRVLVNDGGVSVPVDVTFSINKANQATLTITAPSSATFGAADAAFTTSGGSGIGLITFDAGTSTACTIVGGKLHVSSGTGTCSVIATQAADANYTATSSVAFDITVNKAAPVIVVNGYSGTYDGAAHGATGTATGVLGESLAGLTLGSSFTSVPGGTANWTFAGTGNYNSASGSVAIAIAPKAASVTPDAKSKVYGTTDPTLTGTLSGFLPADAVTATYGRTVGETVGAYTISATLHAASGVLANYSVTSNTATFTITTGSLNHLVLSPVSSTVNPGVGQAYTATGFDIFGNNMGDVTGATTFSIAGGSCTGATCSSTVAGDHVVTGTDGSATGTATLHITGVQGVVSGATYHTVTPVRVLDSRINLGAGLFHSQVKQTVAIATAASGVPANAVAVTGNVTVTGQTRLGYVTVAPHLTSYVIPSTSTINFPVRDNRANGVTVPLAAGGTLDFAYWAAGTTATVNIVFDVTGYFTNDTTGATYHTVTPVRVLDSRTGLGAGIFHSQTKQTVAIVTAASGVPANAIAVTGNVTVTGQTRLGYVTVAPHLTSRVIPSTSTINFPVGENRANNITVPLAAGGTLDFAYWAAGTTATVNVVFDVTGYFTNDLTGATYHTLTPVRVLDSRTGLGAGLFHTQIKQTVAIATTASGVPTTATAVTGNVTVTGQTRLGYVTVAPSLTSHVIPSTSTINFPVGDNRANGITVPLAAGGKLDFAYWAAGTTATVNVVFDVTGYFG